MDHALTRMSAAVDLANRDSERHNNVAQLCGKGRATAASQLSIPFLTGFNET